MTEAVPVPKLMATAKKSFPHEINHLSTVKLGKGPKNVLQERKKNTLLL